MDRIRIGLIIIVFMILNQSCSDSPVLYDNKFILPASEWTYVHHLDGTWTQNQSLSEVSVIMDIIHSRDFGYQNLYLTGEFKKDDRTVWSDTFSIQLAKPNSGQWIGINHGDDLMVSDTIPYTPSLDPGERFQYRFSQFSREEVLQGVEAVKIKIIDH